MVITFFKYLVINVKTLEVASDVHSNYTINSTFGPPSTPTLPRCHWSVPPARPAIGPLERPSAVICRYAPLRLPRTRASLGLACARVEAQWCIELITSGLSKYILSAPLSKLYLICVHLDLQVQNSYQILLHFFAHDKVNYTRAFTF